MRLAHLRTSAAIVLAVMLLVAETRTLYRDPLYPTRALLLVVAVVLPALLIRVLLPRRRWYDWPLWAGQVALGVWLLRRMHSGPPVPQLIAEAIRGIEEGSAPLGASPGLSLVFLALPLLVVVLLELFVHVGRMPGLTIVPLAAWYVVFALVPQPPARPLGLVAVGVGYAAILAADTVNRARRWRQGLHLDTGTGSDTEVTALRIAATLLLPSVAAAWLLGNLLPVYQQEDLKGTNGTLSMPDPRLDLRQNLHASQRRVILTYRTSTPEGVRLKLATMSNLTGDGWDMAEFTSTALTEGAQQFPSPPGLGPDAPTRRRTTTVTVDSFPSTYLPLPYAPSVLTAPKRWGYDPDTFTVYSLSDDPRDAVNQLRYSVDSVEVVPSAAQLGAVTAAPYGGQAVGVPASFPASVRDLTARVLTGTQSPLEKASRLQAFFRDPANGFVYSLDGAPNLAGNAALERFLLQERVGYCEQYATAYAAMARSAGLPSRVVIGFLPGTQNAAGEFEVANLDMHAWPEVWFDGYGWLAFEPTPPQVAEAPAYALPVNGAVPAPTPTPTPSASSSPSLPSAPPSVAPSLPPVAPPTTGPAVGWGLVGGLLAVAAVGALAALPGLLRQRRRGARLAGWSASPDGALGLWHEVRDTVLDLGGRWRPESPRALAAEVGLGLTPGTRDGLAQLAVAVERARFAPTPGEPPRDGAATVHAVVAELSQAATRRQRLVARWWPRSLWVGFSPRRAGGGAARARGARRRES